MGRVSSLEGESFIKRTFRIEENNYRFIREHYTGTSFEWLINELLAAFVDAHKSREVPDLTEIAAEAVITDVIELTHGVKR